MNPNNKPNMHFKSAQIAGVEISPNDMAQINRYALSPLMPEDIFAFKVSMAGNDVDRDFEVFPHKTLSKLARLFVGKTVVKDHDHRSDNQIARIYATDLIESQPTRMTKAGEVFTELIARCYMVKTSTNADLIAEISAGIRKEVSLGCSIGKAICSICGTDNVKTYCKHFGGRQYEGETCYFSLEDPRDAYELSFVAIPAQQHAGTVKSYGEQPCYKADLEQEEQMNEPAAKNLHTREESEPKKADFSVERLVEEAKRLLVDQIRKEFPRLTVNRGDNQLIGSNLCEKCGKTSKMAEDGQKMPENAPICSEIASNGADSAPIEPINNGLELAENASSENLHTRESSSEMDESRLTVNRLEEESNRLTVNHDNQSSELQQESCTQEESSNEAGLEPEMSSSAKGQTEEEEEKNDDSSGNTRLTVNREDESLGHLDQSSVEEAQQAETQTHLTEEDIVQAEEDMRAKQAEARLRALDLALSLYQRNIK